MAHEQPEETQPAAGVPDPTRLDTGSEPSTVDAPARWSASAAVPEPSPKKPWWRRDGEPQPVEEEHWATTPAVDPWADQDTPWDAFPFPEVTEVPATAQPAAPPPPTRVEPPAPTKVEQPPTAAPTAPPPAGAEPPPPKLSKKERKRLEKAATANRLPVQTRPPAPPSPPPGPIVQGRRLPAPPPWAPRQPSRPLPPPRRKRRWGRRLALLSLLGVVCCCGLPFAWFQWPSARQYPVSAALPKSFADLQLRDTEETGPNGFAGVYRDGRGKRVSVYGETGFRLTPGSDVRGRLDQVASAYNLKDVQSFDLGESGAHQSCGVGRDDGVSVVVCAWADHGSLATVLLTRRSITDSADLVARLREEVLSPG
uniref:hypothetical protein n=1 Tax=Paractinoplanes polyasparticus TaxID=2856853 RepID=UPI001C84EE11|nr:hypothetical protein [Actinoplanes polyasparticus]